MNFNKKMANYDNFFQHLTIQFIYHYDEPNPDPDARVCCNYLRSKNIFLMCLNTHIDKF